MRSITPSLSPLSILTVACLCLAVTGCGSGTVAQQQTTIRKLEQQLQQEQTAKQHAAQERVRAEKESRKWQSTVAWVGAFAVLMLIVGTALGARAKNDAENTTSTEEKPNAEPDDVQGEPGCR
jgi:hypothetical protein